jgi:hypothetical protein
VLDADRQPDCGVENAYFLADVGRNAGVGHARRQARKRLGAAQAHRQLEDLQRVEKFECGSLAADNVERERGACAGALTLEQTAGRGVLIEVSKVVDLGHFGMAKQVIRYKPRVRVGIEVANCNSSDIATTLRDIVASPPPAGSDLAEHAAKLHREKYDHFLPDELLKAALAKERLDPESVPDVARRILNPADRADE